MEVVGHLVVVGVDRCWHLTGVATAAAVGLFAKRRPLFTSADFEAFSTNLKINKKNYISQGLECCIPVYRTPLSIRTAYRMDNSV